MRKRGITFRNFRVYEPRFLLHLLTKKAVWGVVVLALALSLLPTTSVYSAPNYQINYQGKLTDDADTPVTNGDYDIVFNLYTAPTGGVAIWTESHTAGDDVTVTNGLFSVMLGSITSLATVSFNQTLYLGVTIESDDEMTPRKILGAVPAAFESDKLDGLDSADFLSTSTASAPKLWSLTGLGNIGSSTATTTVLGNLVAVGNAIINGIISSYQNITAPYFTATSSTASTFPYASTTAVTASGSASTTALIVSGSADFSAFGTGLAKLTSGSLGLAVAGTDYQAPLVAGTDYEVPLTFGDGLTRTLNDVDCDTADGSTFGCLTAANWTIFNNKVSSSSLITLLANTFPTSTDPLMATRFVATGTVASVLPYASTTGLTVSGTTYLGDIDAAGDFNFLFSTAAGNRVMRFYSFLGPRLQRQGDTSAWETNYGFLTNNETDLGGFGGYGTNTALNYFYIGQNRTTPYVVFTEAGNVGIGTTTPGATLGIQGDIFLAGRLVSTSTSATSTFAAPVSLTKIVTSATSTGTNGFDISAGCYAVNGTCISGGGGGSGTVSSGLAGQLAYYASDGTTVSGTTTGISTRGRFVATTSIASIFPYASTTAITVSGTASTTNLIVSNSATIGSFTGLLNASAGAISTFTTSQANPLYFNGTTIAPTSTPTFATFHATSSTASSTAGVISLTKIVTSATSTGSNGFDISAGCFAVNGTCISGGGGGSGTVNSGVSGRLAYYSSSGTTVDDSNLFWDSNLDLLGVATTTGRGSIWARLINSAVSPYLVNPGFNATSTFISVGSGYSGYLSVVPETHVGTGGNGADVHLASGGDGQEVFGSSPDGGIAGNIYMVVGGLGDNGGANANDGTVNVGNGAGLKNAKFNIFGGLRIDTSSTTAFYINNGATRHLTFDSTNGVMGIGSSTPSANFRLSLGGNLYVGGAITATSTATSTFLGPISLTKLNTSATSTGSNGFDISAGCYAVNGTCVSGGSGSGTVNSGSIHGLAYYTGSTDVSSAGVDLQWDDVFKILSISTSTQSGHLFSTYINSSSNSILNPTTTYIGRGKNSTLVDGFTGADTYISIGGDANQSGSLDNGGTGGITYLSSGGLGNEDGAGGIGGTVNIVVGGNPHPSGGTYGNDGTVNIGNSAGQKNATVNLYGTLNVMFRNTATTNGVCHSGTDLDTTDTTNTYSLVACSSAPADIAEFYPTEEGVGAGDIVATTENVINYEAEGADPLTGQIKSLGEQELSVLKRASADDAGILGIVSTGPFQTFGKDINKAGVTTKPIALVGRVPVKVNLDNGPIKPGDLITLSTTTPGVGMRAGNNAATTIGTALTKFDENSNKNSNGVGKINVFVNLSHHKLDSAIVGDGLGEGYWSLDETTGELKPFAALDLGGQNIKNVGAITSASGNWSISADGVLVTKEVRTEKLCVGSVCVNESDLRGLLQMAGIGVTEVVTGGGDDNDNDSNTDTATTTATTTPLVEDEPEEPPVEEVPTLIEDEVRDPDPQSGVGSDSSGDNESEPEPEPEQEPEPAPEEPTDQPVEE